MNETLKHPSMHWDYLEDVHFFLFLVTHEHCIYRQYLYIALLHAITTSVKMLLIIYCPMI